MERGLVNLLRLWPGLVARARLGLPAPVGIPDLAGKSALEIGPGRGHDLVRLKKLGWAPVGIDVDTKAAQRASELAGCRVVVGDVERLASLNLGEFGLIYSSHSIEHVPDPIKALEAMYASLRPGGQLVLVYPNCRSLVCRVFGSDSMSWDPPRHLSLPTCGAMVRALQDLGFRNVASRTRSHQATHYAAVSRANRQGMTGENAWTATGERADRVLAGIETLLVALRIRVGEEAVVWAQK
jgi:SAM-dependent methyltransferase